MTSSDTDRNLDRSPQESEASSSRDHVLTAPILRFELRTELKGLREQKTYAQGKPSGKTLVKEPDLRIVLMALKAGGRMEDHRASGPISVQGIEGRFRLRLPSGDMELTAGELVSLEPGIPHEVFAVEDAAFLLTIGRTTYDHVSDQHEPRP